MKKSFLKQLVREAIDDVSKRENNSVLKHYLGLLHKLEEENTDDLPDFKNLAIALEIYQRELNKKIQSLTK